jgi:hypothetical protein
MRNKVELLTADKVKYVGDHLSTIGRLAAIAEESAELSKAASKLIRIYDGTNPTPVTEADALADLKEEFADTLLAAEAQGLTRDGAFEVLACKAARWYHRVRGHVRDQANKRGPKTEAGPARRNPASPESPYPDGDESVLACPYCGSGEYLYNEDGDRNHFCGQCGQAIAWPVES